MGLFGNDRNAQPAGIPGGQSLNNVTQNMPMNNGGFVANGPNNDDAAMQQSVNNLMGSPIPQQNPAPTTPDYIQTPPAQPSNDVPQNNPTPEPPMQQPVPQMQGMPQNDMPSNQSNGDLTDIKQQALQHLSPIVGHLDQSPEEKFHTTMMMLQATDDQSLVQTAFDIAQSIPDDKARAQALLDVINEINYFTQQKS